MKTKTWKVFFSVSLGIHLLLFSVGSILFPDIRMERIPDLPLEITLLPLLVPEKPIVEKTVQELNPLSPEVKDRKEEKKVVELMTPPETDPRPPSQPKEHEVKEVSRGETEPVPPPEREEKVETVFPPPVPSPVQVVRVDESKPSPVQIKKKEEEEKRRPEPVFVPPVSIEPDRVPVEEPKPSPVQIKKKEEEEKKRPEPVFVPPVANEPDRIPAEESNPFSVQGRKWEKDEKRTPEPVFASPVRIEPKQAVPIKLPGDETRPSLLEIRPRDPGDKKLPEPLSPLPAPSKERTVPVGAPKPPPLEPVRPESNPGHGEKMAMESQRNPAPPVDLPIKPQMSLKQPSSPEGELVLAQPKYVENPKPTYPKEARKKGYEGEVVLRVEVLASGGVGKVEVRQSSGHEILDRSALTTVKQWRFTPGKRGETPVSLWVNIPIRYQLR